MPIDTFHHHDTHRLFLLPHQPIPVGCMLDGGKKQSQLTPKNALETQINRIGSSTQALQQAKKALDWQNSLFYFGSLVVFMLCCFGFLVGLSQVLMR